MTAELVQKLFKLAFHPVNQLVGSQTLKAVKAFTLPRLFAWGGFWQTVSYKLMILCRDFYALLHVITLVDWPKHVKSPLSAACVTPPLPDQTTGMFDLKMSQSIAFELVTHLQLKAAAIVSRVRGSCETKSSDNCVLARLVQQQLS